MRSGYVSNARLRSEYKRRHKLGWIDSHLVAVRLGWYTRKGKPDSSRVLRKLGMSISATHGVRGYQRSMRPDVAARMAEAIGCDPFEVGL